MNAKKIRRNTKKKTKAKAKAKARGKAAPKKTAGPPPRFWDEYVAGLEDKSLRPYQRGLLRIAEFSDGTLEEVIQYAKHLRPEWIATFMDIFGELREDGNRYIYLDCGILAHGMQEAAHLLNRNRTTISQYCKDPTFPAAKTESEWQFDIIACQDWILLNTDDHHGMEAIWPDNDYSGRPLVVMTSDEYMKLAHT